MFRIVSLNTWGGNRYEPLMKFLKHQSKTVDVFCFQEMLRSRRKSGEESGFRVGFFSELAKLLPEHRGIFCAVQDGYSYDAAVDFPLSIGLAIFIRNGISCRTGNFFIFRHRNAAFDDLPGKKWRGRSISDPLFARVRRDNYTIDTVKAFPEALQYVTVQTKGGAALTIAHTHAIWWPGDKLDTPERLAQSKKIIDGLSRIPGEKVLCGDFNLMPTTESVNMIEKAGYRNLIKEYKIKDTRGPINKEKFANEKPLQTYADYVFVSPGVLVKNFEVPQMAVSDHLPLILTLQGNIDN